MAVSAQIKLQPKPIGKTGRYSTTRFETAIPNIEDLGRVIQQIAANEVQKQLKVGNKPTSVIVDNKKSKPFREADYRVVVNFHDTKVMAAGVIGVLNALEKVTRVLTGTAKASFQIWTVQDFKDKGKLINVNAASVSLKSLEKLADSLPPQGRIVVAGPMVDYGRVLFWSPKTRKNSKKTIRSRKSGFDYDTGSITKVKNQRTKNMADIAIRAVRSKFPGLAIVGRWVVNNNRVGKTKQPNRWPGISVGIKN